MKIWWIVFGAIFTLLVSGCEKVNMKRWEVQYKAVNQGYQIPVYRITYMTKSGGTKVVGPINSWHWESEVFNGVEEGSPVQLEIEILSGEASFDMQILRDGALHEHLILREGDKYLIVNSQI